MTSLAIQADTLRGLPGEDLGDPGGQADPPFSGEGRHAGRGARAHEGRQRPAPHNIELEQALLGAILVNNEAFYRVSDFLEPRHFFEPIHQKIYEIAASLVRIGKTATPITLKTFLPADLDVAGQTASQYLARLAAEGTTILNAPDYGRTVCDLAARRSLIGIGQDMVNEAYDAPVDMSPRLLASGAIEVLDEIVASGKRDSTISRMAVSEAADEAVEQMSTAMRNPGAMVGVSYGLRDIDQKTAGLHGGDLVILAGRPGMGKTGLATGIAYRAASAGCATLFFSLEMSARSLAHRVISDICFEERRIPYANLASGKVTNAEAQSVVDASRLLREVPLTIEQEPALTISQIRARARKAQQQFERKGQTLGLIVVDHMHIVRPSDRYRGNRVSELTEISGGLKALAKEFGAPVLALAQLSRAVETREDKRPQLSDLRDSGSLEQDADVVMFAFRAEYYLERCKFDDRAADDKRVARLFEVKNQLEVCIAKQRSRSALRCARNFVRP